MVSAPGGSPAASAGVRLYCSSHVAVSGAASGSAQRQLVSLDRQARRRGGRLLQGGEAAEVRFAQLHGAEIAQLRGIAEVPARANAAVSERLGPDVQVQVLERRG